MSDISVNFSAVIAATVAAMVVGGLWYSPLLFVKVWMKESGYKPEDRDMKKGAGPAMAGQLVASLIIAYVLAHFLGYAGANNAWLGIQGALWIWLGFQATSAASHVFFERKSWTWFAINAGCSFVTAIAMGAILGAWH